MIKGHIEHLSLFQLLVVFTTILLLSSCGNPSEILYQGYVEGEAIYLASPFSGKLTDLFVRRGQTVKKGEQLFRLAGNPEALEIKAQKAELEQAKKIYQDLLNPKRTPEIESIKAQIEQVDAELELAAIRVTRYQTLYDRKATNKDNLDEALARQEQLKHRKAELLSNLQLAKLGSREEQINAQAAKIEAMEAKLEVATWQLSQKIMFAPEDGVIQDTYYQEGEFVGSQQPVLALLAPKDVRIEFFVPVQQLPSIHLDQTVSFTCEGCQQDYKARISYISPEAEFIPPLVYSHENREHLVFRVNAAITNSTRFKPGQPIWITAIDHDKQKRN
ncbi:HlyD family secretion protein [Legionella impletisoli]|uniref:Hemolysin D n=1 Tax=Legionella impletisoli TaxID=343510 RepID=A0A917JX15_9GAMM|nr:HlyD family efflux transporter periplasmic adaptor subunit [Legionella impletisoli]GGI90433.1 hemolysin D [Legionella impletisoli]